MEIITHVNSLLNSATYRIKDCIVDPGDIWDGFNGVNHVLLTHAHFDHIYGLNELLKLSPQALVYTNKIGYDMLLDAKKNMSYYHDTPFIFNNPEQICIVNHLDKIFIGNQIFAEAHYTPGHNPSCITWVIDDMTFTGDSLIPDAKTITNLPGGNRKEAVVSEEYIKKLVVNKLIYPGHKIDKHSLRKSK